MPTNYLNTDLELRSSAELSLLVAELEKTLVSIHHGIVDGKNLASFEAMLNSDFPESSIAELCNSVENLSVDARAIWNMCESRIVDIGVECGTDSQRWIALLSPAILQRLVALNIGIAMTIYPADHANA